ncbi:MAG TPA: CopG family transcriptional regulator [Actinomycetota bacterium]|jgi:hypothetical protein
MKKTTMYLPEELLAELRLRARQERRPVAEIVREASAEYLAKRTRKQPRWIGVAEGPDDGLSGTELKDKLRDEWGEELDARHQRGTQPDADA